MTRHTKSSLIEMVSKSTGASKANVEEIYNSIVENITDLVAAGDVVALSDLGIFGSKVRSGRDGRNPKTGETITIKSKKVPSFKFSKKIKDRVSGDAK